MAAAEVSADSDELARAFRDDVAHRSDMMPLGVGASLAVEILHPALFPMRPRAGTIAAARAAEADEAASKAEQARLAAVTASREAARAMMRVAENLKESAEAQLTAADRSVASTGWKKERRSGLDRRSQHNDVESS